MGPSVSELWQFDLTVGHSNDPSEGACALDACSWLEYGQLGGHLDCVDALISGSVR
jgi:hypothetical protein